MSGITQPQSGAIAHIDKNPKNSSEGNLVFLCLTHHAELDQKDSFDISELIKARNALYHSIKVDEARPLLSPSDYKELEKLVTDQIREQFSDRLGDSFSMHSNEFMRGRSGVSYDVDLIVEFKVAGLRYITIFEIKHKRIPLSTQDMLEFVARANDIGVDKAVIVCGGGYSTGSLRIAAERNITPMEFKPNSRGVVSIEPAQTPETRRG
jgi:hypothetical protein